MSEEPAKAPDGGPSTAGATEPVFKLTQADYLEISGRITEAGLKLSESFDKALLTLSAGALVLSITFLKELAPDPPVWMLVFALAAWGSFIRSLIDLLTSHLLQHEALMEQHQKLTKSFIPTYTERISTDRSHYAKRYGDANPLGEATTTKNRWALRWFIIGSCCLIVFSLINIVAKRIDHERPRDAAKPGPGNQVAERGRDSSRSTDHNDNAADQPDARWPGLGQLRKSGRPAGPDPGEMKAGQTKGQ